MVVFFSTLAKFRTLAATAILGVKGERYTNPKRQARLVGEANQAVAWGW